MQQVRDKAALVILLVDLLDVPGSFLSHVRDLVGKNPIILIGTKLDLLPRGTAPGAVKAWLEEVAHRKKLNILRILLVSNTSGQGGLVL